MFKGKKLVIFDMDGTLIDSVGVWNNVDVVLAEKLGGKRPDAPYVQRLRDQKLRELSSRKDPYLDYCEFLGKLYGSELSPEEIHAMRYGIAVELLTNSVRYKPCAAEFVKSLKAHGIHSVIASTTRKQNMDIYRTSNKNILSVCPPDDYFDRIYTRENAREIKPNPEIYLTVMKDFCVSPGECLVFEDSLIGAEASRRAGIDTAIIYDLYSENDKEELQKESCAYFMDYALAKRALEAEFPLEIRPAENDDLPEILEIYDYARKFMAENGNPTQWGKTDPPRELLVSDIERRQLYVAESCGKLHGVFAFIIGEDPTYGYIENGRWLSDEPYGTIHRIASGGTCGGVFTSCISFCESKIKHLRIDTHGNNTVTQHLIEKHGFAKCGVVYMEDGSARFAFEKV